MNKYFFGWQRDLPDERDWRYRDHPEAQYLTAIPLPKKLDLRPLCPPIKDQGQAGTCVSHAFVSCLEFIQLKALREQLNQPEVFGPQYGALSPLFINYNCHFLDGTLGHDNGTQLRTAVKAIRKFGICEEKLWAYNLHALYRKPFQIAYDQALEHTIPASYRIDHRNIDEVKTCLASGFPISFGIPLISDYMHINNNGICPLPTRNSSYVGGHAQYLCGYNDDTGFLTVANSWGTSFGDQGYVYLPYDYLLNLGSDLWTIRLE